MPNLGIYDYLNENDRCYGYKITRLEMIKFSIYSIINKVLNESPNIKVGLVTFEDYVTIYGDCLEQEKVIKEVKDENRIKRLGDEYSYYIKSNIKIIEFYFIKIIFNRIKM